MERLYKADTLAEAHLLRDLLEEDGLGAFIANESLSSLGGELPFSLVMPEVWVPDSRDVFMARAVLRDFLDRKEKPEAADRKCSACGDESPANFDVCWRCRRPF